MYKNTDLRKIIFQKYSKVNSSIFIKIEKIENFKYELKISFFCTE